MTIEKIYFDMDNVLADFRGGVRCFCGMELPEQGAPGSSENDELMWERIRATKHFYDRLELVTGVKELFDALYEKYGDKCEMNHMKRF